MQDGPGAKRVSAVQQQVHRSRRGPGTYVGLAEIFGVYSPERRSVYLVPVADVPRSVVFLRLDPARNNQQHGIRMAASYEVSRWTPQRLAAVASAGQPPDAGLALIA